MRLRLYTLLAIFFTAFSASAQTFNVTGKVTDATDNSSLIGVDVLLFSAADSTQKNGTVTDTSGNFMITGVATGTYKMRVDYLGYKTYTQTVNVIANNVDLGNLKLEATAKELKGVTVKAAEVRAEQMGDTSQFNANAYKTHPDATAEDLVTKMPGVTSDNNGVKVNGETLQQVYVDGKPFFGNDPTLALKNLPAEVIDKIQVFDKLSDQSSFTGFDDGNAQKTMNIITKGNKREGVFGKLYAGYGTDNTYLAGGNLNIFNGDRRITILGLSNNVNQQNFSAQDILGVMGGGGGRGGGGRGGGGMFGGQSGGGGGASNFFVGQQNGITTTNSFGLNYSDNWGKKIKVSGSYFFNGSDNLSNSVIDRTYFATDRQPEYPYHETDNSEVRNYNHRFNLRFEYNIDSANAIIFTPGVSLQRNFTSNSQLAQTDSPFISPSRSLNFTSNNTRGYSSSDNLLIQHKFKKARRTLSLNINTSINEKTGDGVYTNTFSRPGRPDSSINQVDTTYTNGYTISPTLTYTEPIGKKGQLMANYSPTYTRNIADKETYDRDSLSQTYIDFNAPLSNKYNSTYITEKGGLSYRMGDKKVTWNIGANAQYATLNSDETFPNTLHIYRNFFSVLPYAMLNYRFEDGRNLRVMYRTNTVAPSISQLQNVPDISNPLLLRTGNPDLKQDYEQTLIVRYGMTKSKTGNNFFINFYSNYVSNYIGNATVHGVGAPVEGVLVPVTSQITYPVNLDGYFTERLFLTYSIPLSFIKSNLNLNGGMNYTGTPGLLDNVKNYSNNYIPSAGVVISSNISQNVDFTLSYNANYNIVKNTIQTQANNNYYSHVASAKLNYIFLKRFVLNTNITDNYYTAFSSTGNQNYLLWNAYLGYKFLKNQGLEARISAFDILDQNKSITRNVTESYVENNVTRVLTQYFMFQLTYTIRNFKGAMPADVEGKQGRDFMRSPGGFGPGGPGGPPGGGGFRGGEDH